jgi:hypothetical protein
MCHALQNIDLERRPLVRGNGGCETARGIDARTGERRAHGSCHDDAAQAGVPDRTESGCLSVSIGPLLLSDLLPSARELNGSVFPGTHRSGSPGLPAYESRDP